MNTDDWQELFADLTPVPHDTHAIIVQEDEPSDSLYLIDEGIVSVERSSLQIAFLGAGEWFGEHAALLGARTATAVRLLLIRVSVDFMSHSSVVRSRLWRRKVLSCDDCRTPSCWRACDSVRR